MSVKALVVAVMALSLGLAGCTSMRAIEDFSPSRIRAQVEVGDDVHIVTRKGDTYDLSITRVEADAVVGRTTSGKLWKVPYESIEYIEVEEADLVRTAGSVLVTFYTVVAVVVTAAIIAWTREADEN